MACAVTRTVAVRALRLAWGLALAAVCVWVSRVAYLSPSPRSPHTTHDTVYTETHLSGFTLYKARVSCAVRDDALHSTV